MTTLPTEDVPSSAAFPTACYAEEHLTMYQFMFESTAADPTSRGFLTADADPGQPDDQDPAARVAPRAHLRTYP